MVKLNKSCFLFFLLIFCQFGQSQTIPFNLSGASCLQFKKSMYCFGIQENGNTKKLKVYRLLQNLQIKDSAEFAISSDISKTYLNLSGDTLHDYLNIYVQEKNSKQADIFRFDFNLQLQTQLKKIDVARINNQSVLGTHYSLIKNGAYVVKQAMDSLGMMFYLNKYQLKSKQENFDYLLRWQYPFERKFIQYISILKADSIEVELMVKIYKGPKAGHYYLKIDGKKGQLLKALKLSEGNDLHYMPGGFVYLNAEKDRYVFGQKLMGQQYVNTSLLPANNESVVTLYAMHIDSLGELLDKKTFSITVKDYAAQTQKTHQAYFLKMLALKKLPSGAMALTFDVYKNEFPLNNCFYYVHSQVLHFNFDGESYQVEKTPIQPIAEIERFYRNKDKLDMNGKICIDSLLALPRLYQESVKQAVNVGFKTDDLNNGAWLLAKTETNKKQTSIATLGLKNKVYETKNILSINSDYAPSILVNDTQTFFVGIQESEKKFSISLYRW